MRQCKVITQCSKLSQVVQSSPLPPQYCPFNCTEISFFCSCSTHFRLAIMIVVYMHRWIPLDNQVLLCLLASLAGQWLRVICMKWLRGSWRQPSQVQLGIAKLAFRQTRVVKMGRKEKSQDRVKKLGVCAYNNRELIGDISWGNINGHWTMALAVGCAATAIVVFGTSDKLWNTLVIFYFSLPSTLFSPVGKNKFAFMIGWMADCSEMLLPLYCTCYVGSIQYVLYSLDLMILLVVHRIGNFRQKAQERAEEKNWSQQQLKKK